MIEYRQGEKTFDPKAQLEEAKDILGITVRKTDISNSLAIVFGISSDAISLAQATYEEAISYPTTEKLIIIVSGAIDYILENRELIPVELQGEAFCISRGGVFNHSMNAIGFGTYTENKLITRRLLDQNGIPVPREIHINSSVYLPLEEFILKGSENFETKIKEIYAQIYRKIARFIKTVGRNGKFVAKPFNGKCGEEVRIFSGNQFLQISPGEKIFPDTLEASHILLIQEKIEPYPVILDGTKIDWNMRVLISYDPQLKDYVVVGIVCRMGELDTPVNISINASYTEMEDILSKTIIPKDEWASIIQKIESVALNATKVVLEHVNKKFKKPQGMENIQVLAGIDIILNQDKEPVVIEINDMHSGGLFELMKMRGVNSLAPIAKALIFKVLAGKNMPKIRTRGEKQFL